MKLPHPMNFLPLILVVFEVNIRAENPHQHFMKEGIVSLDAEFVVDEDELWESLIMAISLSLIELIEYSNKNREVSRGAK